MTRSLVVIPAFNEEQALPGALADLAAAVPELDVLVVDDGSQDATSAVARAGGVVVATLPFNLGIGGALRTGFRYACRHGYDRVVQFDGDGQHDAADIPRLLAALDTGADMVIGSRFTHGEREYDIGRTRSGAMRLLRLLVTLLAGRRFSDTSSGFRAFNEQVIDLFARTYPSEYMDSVEALLLASYAGYDVVEIGVRMRERAGGVPSTRSLKLIYHYLRLLLIMVATASRRGRRPQARNS